MEGVEQSGHGQAPSALLRVPYARLCPDGNPHCFPAPSPAKATRGHRNAPDLEEPTLPLLWPLTQVSTLSGFRFSVCR